MISVEHVTKYYGNHAAVRDLQFRIGAGECVGFLGLNGAGKSTTLRLLSCLIMPTAGRITIRGHDAAANPHEIRRFVGFLPDSPPLYDEMTVQAFLHFAGRLRGMSEADVHRRLPEVIDLCGLDDVSDAPIAEISHGFRQRVGIGQAIIHEPALLILDEPTQGLDPVQIVEMRSMIRRLAGQHTILLSTHILAEIEATCDRILMLHEGRIAAEGTESALALRYGSAGGTLEIEVRGAVEETVTAIASATGDSAIEVLSEHAGRVRVRVDCEVDSREAIARAVVAAGLGLVELRRVTSGLESVFVRMSRQDDLAPAPTEAQP